MQAQPFEYKKRTLGGTAGLHCEKISLARLAWRHGTPLYVYSAANILERYEMFGRAFARVPHTVCYSVKANSNLSILRLLARAGSGFDVVSGGELERVLRADRKGAAKAVFSGVGKTAAEMDLALKAGILIFNVESEEELELLCERSSKLRRRARIAFRINPDVFAETHPYISTGLREHKFGVDIGIAADLYRKAAGQRYLDPAGVSVHIGSQIVSAEPFAEALGRVATLIGELNESGLSIRYVDAGGGLGISYTRDPEFNPQDRILRYAEGLRAVLQDLNLHLLLEPGRFIVGNAGILLTRVLYTKQNGTKRFLIVDAAMNDLIRPALYGAHHEILHVRKPRGGRRCRVDVTGPICESGDFFARDREMPETKEGDLLAIMDTGAYGSSLASNYNSRPRPAEILVHGNRATVIRKRERFSDLVRGEV